MGIINTPRFDETYCRNLAFQLLVALRDMLYIALARNYPPSYEQTFNVLNFLNKSLYAETRYLIKSKNESDVVGYFKEEASLQSEVKKKKITADVLIKKEIKRLKILIRKANLPEEEIKHIRQRLAFLNSGLENLQTDKVLPSELTIPVCLEKYKNWFPLEEYFPEYYVDFLLPLNKILRVRVIFPKDSPVTDGVELIYENYDQISNSSRLFIMSYITWLGGYIKHEEYNQFSARLNFMKNHTCETGLCNDDNPGFRFPHCASFIRLTDQIESAESKLYSSSLLIPNCSVSSLHSGSVLLNRRTIKPYALKMKLFSELYSLKLVGSEYHTEETMKHFFENCIDKQRQKSIILFVREKDYLG